MFQGDACKRCCNAQLCVVQNATEELERLEHAFDSVKKQLFRRLHDVARAQLFQQAPAAPTKPRRLMLGAGSDIIPDESSNGASSQREQSESVRL